MDLTLQCSLFVGLFLTATGGVAEGLQCFGEYCFSLPDPAQSMVRSDASTYCTNSGMRLLEVGTRDAIAAVQGFFNSTSGQSSYFTGSDVIMNADQDKRRDMYTWVNGNTVSGVTVVPGSSFPQDYYAYANLERTSSAVQMYGGLTTNRYGYICEYDSTWQPCVFPSNNRCFVSSSETVTWFEARNRCLLNGGDLAVFDYIGSDPGMNQLSGDWLTINAKYWVGTRRVYWTWSSTGSDARYTNFAVDKPNTYSYGCLCLSRSTQWQQWTDCDCSIAYPFLCFTVVPTTTPGSTTTLSSSLSTSSSATTTRTSTTTPTTTMTSTTTTSSSSTTTSTRISSSSTTSTPSSSTSSSSPSSSSPSSSSSPPPSSSSSSSSTTLPTSSASSTLSSFSTSNGNDFPSPSFDTGSTSVPSTQNPGDTSSVPSSTTAKSLSPDLKVGLGVGIGVGLGVPLLLIILIVFLVIRRRRKKSKPAGKIYYEITYETQKKAEDNNYEGLKDVSELKENNYEGLKKDGSELNHAYEQISEIGIKNPAKEDVPP